MQNKLPFRQRLMCAIIVVCVCVVYLGFCLFAVSAAWQRKEGELAPVSSWVQSASLFAVAFPFGFLPGFRSLFVAPILNGLVWSSIVGIFYARHLHRKIA
jgi:TRAP-type C4-dicarboxylate transport system permease small subunit